MCTPVTRP
uniref:Uncharacterized protein n=1 Tax=Rhizophora mucronata TaxID=61149 RepID=A0A2P2QJ12_RHIMU